MNVKTDLSFLFRTLAQNLSQPHILRDFKSERFLSGVAASIFGMSFILSVKQNLSNADAELTQCGDLAP